MYCSVCQSCFLTVSAFAAFSGDWLARVYCLPEYILFSEEYFAVEIRLRFPVVISQERGISYSHLCPPYRPTRPVPFISLSRASSRVVSIREEALYHFW